MSAKVDSVLSGTLCTSNKRYMVMNVNIVLIPFFQLVPGGDMPET